MKPFQGFNHGTGPIMMSLRGTMIEEYRPIEIHLKEDGTLTDGPSVAILLEKGFNTFVYGQLSIAMFNEGLSDIGYKLMKL